MTAVGALLMAAGVAIILTAPDLSGATLLGAAVFLGGLWVAQATEADRGYPHTSRPCAECGNLGASPFTGLCTPCAKALTEEA